MAAAFLKCYLAYTSSSDALCRQSQAVFPLAHTYLSCLSFFNPCSSGPSDNLLDVCCCQGTGLRVQVLHHIPQWQQHVQSHSVLLRTSWHKGCVESRPARESLNCFKRLNASQGFWARDIFLRQEGWTRWSTEVPSNPYHSVILWFCDWREGGEHSPSSLFETGLSARMWQNGRHQSRVTGTNLQASSLLAVSNEQPWQTAGTIHLPSDSSG